MDNMFYDIYISGFRIQTEPHKIIIYDDLEEIHGTALSDKIVEYCKHEGFIDEWYDPEKSIKVVIMRLNK